MPPSMLVSGPLSPFSLRWDVVGGQEIRVPKSYGTSGIRRGSGGVSRTGSGSEFTRVESSGCSGGAGPLAKEQEAACDSSLGTESRSELEQVKDQDPGSESGAGEEPGVQVVVGQDKSKAEEQEGRPEE